jgi:L,D-transpeptidase ErfK/SrfK
MPAALSGWIRPIMILAVLIAPSGGPASEDERGRAGSGGDWRADLAGMQARQTVLRQKLARQAPADVYIVVDTARNRLYVKRGEEILLDAVASTGSGTILDDPDRPGSRWVFDTPRGEFTIKSKLVNPVWIKPDWAFVEEGMAVPQDPSQRVETGILGEYALGFGKGYFIHGTLYTRLLGKNVTHGCIRLKDEDLRAAFELAKIGTPVLIF